MSALRMKRIARREYLVESAIQAEINQRLDEIDRLDKLKADLMSEVRGLKEDLLSNRHRAYYAEQTLIRKEHAAAVRSLQLVK